MGLRDPNYHLTPPHFPLLTGNHLFVLYICGFVSVLLYPFTSFIFLDSIYKW